METVVHMDDFSSENVRNDPCTEPSAAQVGANALHDMVPEQLCSFLLQNQSEIIRRRAPPRRPPKANRPAHASRPDATRQGMQRNGRGLRWAARWSREKKKKRRKTKKAAKSAAARSRTTRTKKKPFRRIMGVEVGRELAKELSALKKGEPPPSQSQGSAATL